MAWVCRAGLLSAIAISLLTACSCTPQVFVPDDDTAGDDDFCQGEPADDDDIADDDDSAIVHAWVELLPAGEPPPPRWGAAGAYAAATNRLIVFGGHTNGETENRTFVLTHANGLGGEPEWKELQPDGAIPPPMTDHGAVYDPEGNRLIVSGHDGNLDRCDVWVLEGADGTGDDPTWDRLQPEGGEPPACTNHAVAYDPENDLLIAFGGNWAWNGISDEVWILSGASGQDGTPTWSRLSTTGSAPNDLYSARAFRDPSSNRMLVMNGRDHLKTRMLTHANGLDGDATWLTMPFNEDEPPPRISTGLVYDAASNRAVLFGGQFSDNTAYGDTWVLTDANALTGPPIWREAFPQGDVPPGKDSAVVVHDPVHDRLIVFSGQPPGGGFTNDVWVLDCATCLE